MAYGAAAGSIVKLIQKLIGQYGIQKGMNMARKLGFPTKKINQAVKKISGAPRGANLSIEQARPSFPSGELSGGQTMGFARGPAPPLPGGLEGARPAAEASLGRLGRMTPTRARPLPPEMAEMMRARAPRRLAPQTRGDDYRAAFEKRALEGMRGYSPLNRPGQRANPRDRASLMTILKALGLLGSAGIATKVGMSQLGEGGLPGADMEDMI